MNEAKYALLYLENSDARCAANARYFKTLEHAQQAMLKDYWGQRAIFDPESARDLDGPDLPFPEEEYVDDDYRTSVTEKSIYVADGIDTYSWEIEEIKTED